MNYKTALVTGGGGGLGRALAQRLARRGVKLGLIDFNKELLAKTVAELSKFEVEVVGKVCDVRDQEALEIAVAEIENEIGPIDLCIANAGVIRKTAASDLNFKHFKLQFDVNTLGALGTLYATLPGMIQRGQGRLVGISSVSSFAGLPTYGGYSASKAAFTNALEALTLELASSPVKVTTICPGFIKTDMTAPRKGGMPFIMELEFAADKIFAAIISGRRKLVFPWPMRILSWMRHMVPFAVINLILGKRKKVTFEKISEAPRKAA